MKERLYHADAVKITFTGTLAECLTFKECHEEWNPDTFVVIELINRPSNVDFIDPT